MGPCRARLTPIFIAQVVRATVGHAVTLERLVDAVVGQVCTQQLRPVQTQTTAFTLEFITRLGCGNEKKNHG